MLIRSFILVLFISLINCQETPKLEEFKDHILLEAELRKTTDKAISYIKAREYENFFSLFETEAFPNMTKQSISKLLDQLNSFIEKNGLPENENIVPSLSMIPNKSDTLILNNIIYMYKNSGNWHLTFSFLKKFGTNKIIGVNLKKDGFENKRTPLSIKKLEKFNFDLKEVTKFRIYYSESKPYTKSFNNVDGIFAIDGDNSTIKKANLTSSFNKIFEELKKSKYQFSERFENILDRGKNPEYIQLNFALANKPYSIFLYLAIKNGGKYQNHIVLRQQQFGNLGYTFYLRKENYQILMKELEKLKSMSSLKEFYVADP